MNLKVHNYIKNQEKCVCECHYEFYSWPNIICKEPCCHYCNFCDKNIRFELLKQHKHILENEFKNE